MTKVKTKHVVLSATLALVAALSACAKPGDAVRAPKTETAPSPAADPGKAAVENKANEDKIKAEAEAANATPEAKAAKELKAEQLKASLDKMSEDIKKELETNKTVLDAEQREKLSKAPTAEELNGQPVASIPGMPATATVAPKAEAKADASTTPAAPEAPAVASLPELTAGPVGVDGNPSATTDIVAAATVPVPVAAAPVSQIDAEKRALIISLIKPSMKFNYEYSKNRTYIEAVKKLAALKPDATKSEAFQRALKAMSLKETASFDEVLARVDMVNLSFVVPLLLVESADKLADAKANREVLREAMAKLNVSEKDEDVRFRNMRAQMRKSGLEISSVDLMKAYFGTASEAVMTEGQKQTLVLVKDVMKVLSEPDAQKEISDVRAKLAAQLDVFAEEKQTEQVTRP